MITVSVEAWEGGQNYPGIVYVPVDGTGADLLLAVTVWARGEGFKYPEAVTVFLAGRRIRPDTLLAPLRLAAQGFVVAMFAAEFAAAPVAEPAAAPAAAPAAGQ